MRRLGNVLATVPWGRVRRGSGLIALVALTLVLAYATIRVGLDPQATKLSAALLQVMTLLFGVFTAHVYSNVAADQAARDVIRPHARASIRRSVHLYRAMERHAVALQEHLRELSVSSSTDDHGNQTVNLEAVKWSIVGLDRLVREHLATAKDALEDWRDIVPEEVEKIYQSADAEKD